MIINSDTIQQGVSIKDADSIGTGLSYKDFGLYDGTFSNLFFSSYINQSSTSNVGVNRIPLYSVYPHNGGSSDYQQILSATNNSINSFTINSSNRQIVNCTFSFRYSTGSSSSWYTSVFRNAKAIKLTIQITCSGTATGSSDSNEWNYIPLTVYFTIGGIQSVAYTQSSGFYYNNSQSFSNKTLSFTQILPLAPGYNSTRYYVNDTQAFDFASENNTFNYSPPETKNISILVYAKTVFNYQSIVVNSTSSTKLYVTRIL